MSKENRGQETNMELQFLYTFAATYNCDAYGAGDYSGNENCTTATDGSSTTSSGGLANTGFDIALGIGAGLALMVVAAIIVMRLKAKKPAKNN